MFYMDEFHQSMLSFMVVLVIGIKMSASFPWQF